MYLYYYIYTWIYIRPPTQKLKKSFYDFMTNLVIFHDFYAILTKKIMAQIQSKTGTDTQ